MPFGVNSILLLPTWRSEPAALNRVTNDLSLTPTFPLCTNLDISSVFFCEIDLCSYHMMGLQHISCVIIDEKKGSGAQSEDAVEACSSASFA